MSKAMTMNRVECTQDRSIIYICPPVPVQMVNAAYDEESGVVMSCGTGAEVCPVCGSKILHEAGCVRCPACGWSMC